MSNYGYRDATLSNFLTAGQLVTDISARTLAVFEQTALLAGMTHDISQSSAQQNAEVVKIVMKVKDIAASMEEIITKIENTMIDVNKHSKLPV